MDFSILVVLCGILDFAYSNGNYSSLYSIAKAKRTKYTNDFFVLRGQKMDFLAHRGH